MDTNGFFRSSGACLICRIPRLRQRNDVLPDAGSTLSGPRPDAMADHGILNQKDIA